jgi:hypothetical protein
MSAPTRGRSRGEAASISGAPWGATTQGAPADGALRAEHDDLARRLEVRVSIDELKKAFLRLFLGVIAVGLTIKLGWDRWGTLPPGIVRKHSGPPVFLWVATAAALVLLVLALRALVRARRLARDEDRLFARYRRVRAELGLDG